MNRPERPTNLNLITIRAHDNYTLKLEEYCDELEKQYDRALSDVVRYTMALDILADKLSDYEFLLAKSNYPYLKEADVISKERWKEWALRGVSEESDDD